ncbi:MAG: outer membrane beta-barrel protein [Gemmatimonadetes bacterium]|nr:outer membrane beta-barrel protein [Gemmatimonadota bacterium]
MKTTVFAAVLAAVAASAADVQAQMGIPLSVEGRLDYAVPTGDFDDAVDEGVSVSGGVSLGVRPGLALYGTYSNTRFGVGLTSDDEPHAEDSGFSVGLTAALPGGSARVAPWIGAGAVFHTLELGGVEEGIDESVGFEVGGGVAIGLTRNVRLTPGVGFRRYSAELPALLGTREMDVSYFTAGVGLNFSF